MDINDEPWGMDDDDQLFVTDDQLISVSNAGETNNSYDIDEFFSVLKNRDQIEYTRVPSFDFITELFTELKTKWIDDEPNLNIQSYYKWLLAKVSDEPSVTDDEIEPIKIEELFAKELIGLYGLFRFCKQIPDATQTTYISETEEGIARRGLLSHIIDSVSISKDYMTQHSMMTHHIQSRKYVNLTSAERRINMVSDTNLKPHQVVENWLLDQLSDRGYRHHKGYCYERKMLQGPGNKFSMAWDRKVKLKTFIQKQIKIENNYAVYKHYTSHASYTMNATLARFLTQDSDQTRFPALDPNRHIYSYKNGFYHTEYIAYFPYDDPSKWPLIFKNAQKRMLPHDPRAADWLCPSLSDTCLKHYDLEFEHGQIINEAEHLRDIPLNSFLTPDLDNILNYQGLSEETIDNVYSLLGRLFYDIKHHDDMQLLLVFKGVAGSGKSSVINFIAECFDEEAMGTINSNTNDRFSLAHLADCDVCACSELKADLQFNQAVLQQCVSGERTTVEGKGKDLFSQKWRAPFIMAGNELPRWRDASGSMARRLALILFNRRVIHQDEGLFESMKKSIAHAIPKMTIMYRLMVIRSEKKGFWSPLSDGSTIASKQMLATRNEILAELQPLVNHITRSGKYELTNMDESLQRDDTYITESVFLDNFRNWCHSTNIKMPTWNGDTYNTVFEDYGIEKRIATLDYDGSLINGYFLFGIRAKQSEIN